MGEDKISQLAKRDYERKLGLEHRRSEKNTLSALTEKLVYFEQTFQAKKREIEEMLRQCNSMSTAQLSTHFNSISNEILQLQKYVASSNIFLRTFDIKKCHEVLQELSSESKRLEDELLPKKRFGFKNKQKPKVTKAQPEPQHVDEPDFGATKSSIVKEFCGYVNQADQTLQMLQSDIFQRDVTLEKLSNCTIHLLGTPSTLHLTNLKDCHIFAGPVSTSIFVDNCQNCKLTIACQQLRLHNSSDLVIRLHVTSRAIMEDCRKITVGPYNWTYESLDDHFAKSGLDRSINNYTCVDDFNWLNEKQSPNWALLAE